MARRQTEVQLELHGGRKSREGNFRNGKCLVRNELTKLFRYIIEKNKIIHFEIKTFILD